MSKYLGKSKLNYIHKTLCIGSLIRIAFFKLGHRWTLRVEIGQGWENCK